MIRDKIKVQRNQLKSSKLPICGGENMSDELKERIQEVVKKNYSKKYVTNNNNK